ncbi:MAG: CDP-alcohol phosphatidyltransferase [Spirochaetes bacterium]|nr:MAG: CDP-alcohol phosphatidyltransferase [Spirochaetota bacterium]
MAFSKVKELNKIIEIISNGRKRTNILKGCEQKAIAFLVTKIPEWISSDLLTLIGVLGNIIVSASFLLAKYYNRIYLLIGILGFFVSWFGDSLDGRIAYYRNKPRKWYGFTLDFTMDWIGIVLIGLSFIIFLDNSWKILGYLFVTLYGWEMMTALMRYKVTGKYSIDSGIFGPTEVRIIISIILIIEVIFNRSIIFFAIIANVGLLIANIMDFIKLLKSADSRDKQENKIIEN